MRLAAIVWMRGVQEVLEQFVSFDDGEVRVSKLHDRALCPVADRDHAGRLLCAALKPGERAVPDG
jgi:hypothetical protein